VADWRQGLGWSHYEERAFSDIGRSDNAVFEDRLLKQAYDIGWFNHDVDKDYRKDARDFAIEWLSSQYGIDFDEVFDWGEWRERYANGEV
jgi:hypothetical protein